MQAFAKTWGHGSVPLVCTYCKETLLGGSNNYSKLIRFWWHWPHFQGHSSAMNISILLSVFFRFSGFSRWNAQVNNTVFAQRPTELGGIQDVKGETSLQRTGVSSPGVWQFWIHKVLFFRRIRKCAKACCQICNRKLELWNWEYNWQSWTIKMGIPQEKEKRQ